MSLIEQWYTSQYWLDLWFPSLLFLKISSIFCSSRIWLMHRRVGGCDLTQPLLNQQQRRGPIMISLTLYILFNKNSLRREWRNLMIKYLPTYQPTIRGPRSLFPFIRTHCTTYLYQVQSKTVIFMPTHQHPRLHWFCRLGVNVFSIAPLVTTLQVLVTAIIAISYWNSHRSPLRFPVNQQISQKSNN